MSKASWEDTPPIRRLIARVLKLAGIPGFTATAVDGVYHDGPGAVLVGSTGRSRFSFAQPSAEDAAPGGYGAGSFVVSADDLGETGPTVRAYVETDDPDGAYKESSITLDVNNAIAWIDIYTDSTADVASVHGAASGPSFDLVANNRLVDPAGRSVGLTLDTGGAGEAYIVMSSPDGTPWKLTISNTGTVTVTAA